MIFLIVAWIDIAISISSHLFFLKRIRVISGRPYCFCVAFYADGPLNVVLADIAVNGSWREFNVGEVSGPRQVGAGN